MKTSDCHLGFIGFGHMAQVLFQAIHRSRLIPRQHIFFAQKDSAKMKENEQKFQITAMRLETLVERSDLLLLCTPPSATRDVLQQLVACGASKKMLASVVTGVPISFYEKYLGVHSQILRAMPNLASSVGEGMTLFSFGSSATGEFKSLTHLLFASMGRIVEIPESMMNLGTAAAGSGPGFIFCLIEAMARFLEKGGVAYDMALPMAAQVFLGAAKVILEGGVPEQLIRQVATPGGTTEAGYEVMRKTHLEHHFQEVIGAAEARARQLAESGH